MANTSGYTLRIDPTLRVQSEALFAELGMSLETAINIFLKKCLNVGGFPFDVRLESPNRETLEAMMEAERIASDPAIQAMSVEETLEELKK